MGLSKALLGASAGLSKGMDLVDFMNRLKELQYQQGKRAESDSNKEELKSFLSSNISAREAPKVEPIEMVKSAPDWKAPMALKASESTPAMGPQAQSAETAPTETPSPVDAWKRGIQMPQGPMSRMPGLDKTLSDTSFITQLAEGLGQMKMRQDPDAAPEILKNQIATKRKQDALLALDSEVDGLISAKGYQPSSNDYRKLMTIKADIDNEDFDTASKRLYEFRDERDLLSDEEREFKRKMALTAAAGKSVGETRRGETAEYSQEMGISNSMNSDPFLKSIPQLDAALGNVTPAYQVYLKSPTKEAAQYLDQQLMFAFNKLLDPNSVVMPGEFLRTKLGQTVADKLMTDLSTGAFTAGMLRPEQREAIIQSLQYGKEQAINRGQDSYLKYKDMANRYLSNPSNVTKTYDKYFSQGQLVPQLSPEDEEALKWANANPNDPRASAIKQRLGR